MRQLGWGWDSLEWGWDNWSRDGIVGVGMQDSWRGDVTVGAVRRRADVMAVLLIMFIAIWNGCSRSNIHQYHRCNEKKPRLPPSRLPPPSHLPPASHLPPTSLSPACVLPAVCLPPSTVSLSRLPPGRFKQFIAEESQLWIERVQTWGRQANHSRNSKPFQNIFHYN